MYDHCHLCVSNVVQKYLWLNHDFFFFYRTELLNVQTQQNVPNLLNMQSNMAIKGFDQSLSTKTNTFEGFIDCHKKDYHFQ